MRILTVLNDRHAQAGIFGEAILKRGGFYDALVAPDRRFSLDPTAETGIPQSPGAYDGLIVLGGLMSATDDAEHPYLPELASLMRAFEADGRPVLGICLGAQLMARAWGARCWRMDRLEIGYVPLRMTDAGTDDRLFAGLEPDPRLMQWHQDSFDLPPGAELLIEGDAARNQAFRIGEIAYGLQFHCEAGVDTLRQWIMAYAHRAEDPPEGFVQSFERDVERHHFAARRWAEHVAERWVDLVADTRAARQAA